METVFPVFASGQTLTAHDLNQQNAFHHDRERLLGLLAGFGINAGLTGRVTGGTVTISPGLAIDQVGEPMLLDTERSFALPPVASAEVFDVVEAAAGGFSVVLESTDTVTPAPDCGDPDCAGHAEQHTRGVQLSVVAGRVTGPRFDFSREPLLTAVPLTLGASPGDYSTLREAIATRLTNGGDPLISPASITALRATSIAAADIAGVRDYKAGFLDQVLFATLDLLRITRLLELPTNRSSVTRPAVVLGWVHQIGGNWLWDCGFRHAWEPPTGLVRSLLGGSCADPTLRYREEVEALIATYSPPQPPPSGGGGGVVVTPGDFQYCKGGNCITYYPPRTIPDEWQLIYLDAIDPLWNPPNYRDRIKTVVTDIYQNETFIFFGEDVVDATPALGWDSSTVLPVLQTRLTELSGSTNVLVKTQAEAEALPGFEVAGSIGLVDTGVLVTDARGVVVATGRIPAVHTARDLGTQLPQAVERSDRAITKATAHDGEISALNAALVDATGKLGATEAQIVDLQRLSATTTTKLDLLDGRIAGLGEKQAELGPLVTRLDAKVVEVEGLAKNLRGSVDTLNSFVAGGAGGRRAVPGSQLTDDGGRSLIGFGGLVVDSLATLVTADNERTLGRSLGAAKEALAALDVVTATGGQPEIGTAAVALLGTLRSAVKAAGVSPEQARAIDAQFGVVKGMVG